MSRSGPFGILLLAALMVSPAAALAEEAPQSPSAADLITIHDRCVAFVHAHPQVGLERAKLWEEQGGGFYASHCIAMALFDLHDYAAAAERFESLATAMMGVPAAQRAQSLDQAGQSWLAANRPDRAKAAFDAAIQLNGDDADLRIDRAEAFAALKQYWDALDDLNRAIDLAPDRADAYFYRGAAYRNLDTLDLALQNVEQGLKLAPDAPIGLLERGNIRRLKGDFAGARSDWRRVAELAPKSPEAAAAQTNLKKLDAKAVQKAPTAKTSP
jgi:tetratricopeptide (TPR) repeat protein